MDNRMTAQQLKNSILQMAVQGKLVPQDPNDEPASVLLERIRKEKEQLIKEGKIKKNKKESYIFRGADNLHYEQIGKEIRCIEDELPFEIPDNWEWTNLGYIAFITKLAGFEYTKYISQNITNRGVPLFKGKNVQNGLLIENFEAFIPESLSDSLERSQLTKKCLLTPYVGSIGNIAIFNGNYKAHLGSNVGKIEMYSNLVIEEYALLFLQSPEGYNQLSKYKKSTAQESISIDALRNTWIPIPPTNEQKLIVNRFNILKPLIEKYQLTEEKLYKLNSSIKEQIKKSILQYAIEGKLVPQDLNDEPASVLLERIYKEQQKLITEGKIKKDKNESIIYRRDNSYYEKCGSKILCIDEEIPFEIPNDWRWIRLGKLTYNHGQKKPNCDFCYIDIGSINNKLHKLNENETVMPVDKAPSRARKIVEIGDVLYSTVRPYLHNMCIVNRNFSLEPIASTGFAVLTCHSNYLNEFLFMYMMSPTFDQYANKHENSKGVAYPAINDSRLSVALIPVPPVLEQKKIIDKYKNIINILT